MRQRVEGYLNARASEDTADSAAYLLPSGLEIFERMRGLALSASFDETRALRPVERLAVLYFRQIFPREQLESAELAVLATSLSEQRPPGDEVTVARIDRVELRSSEATAYYFLGDTELTVRCKHLEGVWWVDLSSTWDASADAFDQEFTEALERTGGDEIALTEDLLRATTGVAFDQDLWSPPTSEASAE